ncbi:hypothetical protein QYM36_007991 [Artemia franciscana]|uniref:Uncharacterized protein n=1 Tax=Artemia franciscana TaxID=6661 RepID=A0AA88IFF6_ARTSF|nr:hypothetical protein QYM36_007991 [Artemia franciscana]
MKSYTDCKVGPVIVQNPVSTVGNNNYCKMDKNLELKTQQEDIQSSDEEHISKGERWAPVGATDPDSELGKARHDSLSYSEAPESWAE